MSTQLVLGAAGAVIGSVIPGVGTQVGWMIGSTVGGLVDQNNAPDVSPGDLSAPQLQQGSPLPRLYGTTRVTVNPVWASAYTATANDAGGKGGPPDGSAGYTYTLDVLGTIAHRSAVPIIAITRVWVNKKLVETRLASSTAESLAASAVTDAYTSLTLYPGGGAQTPPPTYETAVGTPAASAYRNVATVEIVGLQCGSSQTPPLVEVECITAGAQDGAAVPATYEFTGRAITGADSDVYTSALYARADGDWSIEVINIEVTAAANAVHDGIVQWRSDPDLLGPFRVWLYMYGSAGELRVSVENSAGINTAVNMVGLGSVDLLLTFTDSTNLLEVFVDYGAGYVSVGSVTTSLLEAPGLYSHNIEIGTYPAGSTATYGYDLVRLTCNTGVSDSWTPAAADLADIVEAELSLNPAITLADHDYSALVGTDVLGFKALGPPAKTLAELADIFYFDLVPSNPMRYEPRGVAVVGAIAWADTGAGVDGPGASFSGLKAGSDIEIPGVIGLAAPTIESDHEPVFERGDRLTNDGPNLEKRRTQVVLTASQVKGRAIAASLSRRASAYNATFGLSDKYAVAEPGDSYTVSADDAATYNLLIRRLTYSDGVRACDWELYDTTALVETGITDTNYTPSIVVATPVDSNLVAIDGPILQDADDDAGAYTAIEGEGDAAYPGGVVRRSVDDLDFSEIATNHATESVVGIASDALDAWTGGYVWDETSSVTVTVGTGQTLASATAEAMQLDRMLNVAFIGEHGRWEVIRFKTATLGAVGVYTLTGLLRGCRGTEAHMATHVIADTFVLATTAGLRRMSGTVVDIGATRYLKAVTTGRSAATAASEAFVNDAVGLLPFSPTDLRASRDGSANITFTWARRTRLQTRYGGPGGSVTPLGEGSERYEIDVYATSGYATVLRTIAATAETAAYSAADQTTDFGSAQATVYCRVYQLSDAIGRGSPLQAAA